MIIGSTRVLKPAMTCVFACLLFLSPAGVNGMPVGFTIGVVCEVKTLLSVLEGFKTGMTKLGYVEGKDVKYIISVTGGNKKEIAAKTRVLLAQKADLLLTIGNQAAITAKEITEANGIPVLATACMNPVESGIVKSLNYPGGSVTGVMVPKIMPKALEWLKTIIPGLKKIYVPYNPEDEASETALFGIEQAASRLDLTIVCKKINSAEEAIRDIETLPKDIQAILRIPSPTLAPRIEEISRAAIKKGLPLGAISSLEKEEALVVFSADLYEIGMQASRLVNQIRLGVKPSDIPFEQSEAYLTINLKTAEKLRIKISDDVLAQAKNIIR